jgi:hypothetical protein
MTAGVRSSRFWLSGVFFRKRDYPMNAISLRPNDLATLATDKSERRRVVEIVSRSYPSGAIRSGENFQQQYINVRMVPGDAATLAVVLLADLLPLCNENGKVITTR